MAKSIVSSNLVKTAIHGEDANFGRIVTAMGYASKHINPHATNVSLCQVDVVKAGMSVAFDEAYLKKQLEADNIIIEARSEEHTSELQSRFELVCRLLLEKKK